MANKPIVSPAQQTLNDSIFQRLLYTPKQLTIGKGIRFMPYRPSNYNPTATTQSTILDKSNNTVNKTNSRESIIPDID
jgi:hypothetical protein